jgi:hypothetical protein
VETEGTLAAGYAACHVSTLARPGFGTTERLIHAALYPMPRSFGGRAS